MKKVLVLAAAAAAMALGAGSATAAKPLAPYMNATPSAACNILVTFRPDLYASFGQCMRTVNQRIASFRFPSDADPAVLITLSQRCTQFEQGVYDPVAGEFFRITYPFAFEEGPDWPFPVLVANNHRQCETALYTYHALFEGFGE